MIRESVTSDSSWIPGSSVNTGKKELDTYRAIHERTPPKAGFKLWCNGVANIYFWSDLSRVVFDPTPDDSGEEALSLLFHNSAVVLRGHCLGRTLDDFQNHRVDMMRLTSRDSVLRNGKDEIVITSMQVLTPSKGKGKKG